MNDLPTFTAEDFINHDDAEVASLVNRRLKEWVEGLPAVKKYDCDPGWYDHDTIHATKSGPDHQAYIFGVEPIRKGVTKSEIVKHLRAMYEPSQIEWLAQMIERRGIINE